MQTVSLLVPDGRIHRIIFGVCLKRQSNIFNIALDLVYTYSGGSKVCTNCLIYDSANGKRIINDAMVRRVIGVELA